MDIAALSMAMSQDKILSAFSTAMLKDTLNVQEEVGAEVVEMIDSAAMERSVDPSIGSSVDISI